MALLFGVLFGALLNDLAEPAVFGLNESEDVILLISCRFYFQKIYISKKNVV